MFQLNNEFYISYEGRSEMLETSEVFLCTSGEEVSINDKCPVSVVTETM